MNVKEKMRQAVDAILASRGPSSELNLGDLAALLKAASYDDKGHINDQGLAALSNVSEHYRDRMPDVFRIIFENFVASLPNDSAVYVKDGGKAAPPAQRRKPATANAGARPRAKEQSRPAEPQFGLCGRCGGLGRQTCSSCGGTGSRSRSATRARWDRSVEYYQEQIPCSSCSGGRIVCSPCGGSGRVQI